MSLLSFTKQLLATTRACNAACLVGDNFTLCLRLNETFLCCLAKSKTRSDTRSDERSDERSDTRLHPAKHTLTDLDLPLIILAGSPLSPKIVRTCLRFSGLEMWMVAPALTWLGCTVPGKIPITVGRAPAGCGVGKLRGVLSILSQFCCSVYRGLVIL